MLWQRNKALNQPPGYGRVGRAPDKKPDRELEKAAERALSNSQSDRAHKTLRHGARRAVVVDGGRA